MQRQDAGKTGAAVTACAHLRIFSLHDDGQECMDCGATSAPNEELACGHPTLHRGQDGYACADCGQRVVVLEIGAAPPCTGLADLASSDNA